MSAIINKTYKTEAGADKAIVRETAKAGGEEFVNATKTANDDGTFLVIIEAIDVESADGNDNGDMTDTLDRDDDGNVIIPADPEHDAEMAKTAKDEAKNMMRENVKRLTYPVTCSIQRRHMEQIAEVAKAAKISRRRSPAILPVFNCAATREVQSVRDSSKVGRIISACAGMGSKASDLMPIFVKKNGTDWDRASIDCVFRWDLTHKGYSVQTVEDPNGIDHVYVIRVRGLEVDDLTAVAESHGYVANDNAEIAA